MNIGDKIQNNSSGHVGYVTSVTGDTVTLSSGENIKLGQIGSLGTTTDIRIATGGAGGASNGIGGVYLNNGAGHVHWNDPNIQLATQLTQQNSRILDLELQVAKLTKLLENQNNDTSLNNLRKNVREFELK